MWYHLKSVAKSERLDVDQFIKFALDHSLEFNIQQDDGLVLVSTMKSQGLVNAYKKNNKDKICNACGYQNSENCNTCTVLSNE